MCWLGFLAIEQRAAGARDGELAVVRPDAPAISALDERVVVRRRRDVRAALQQRQRAAADEVDLEAEEIVLRAGRGGERVEAPARDLEAAASGSG